MKKKILPLLALLLVVLAGCGPKLNDHVTDYHIDLPAGFEEIEMEGVDKCWSNAAQTGNVNLKITAKAGSANAAFKAITADIARETIASAWKESYGSDPVITDRYFSKDPVAGLPAYQYSYVLEWEGQTVTQILVSVNADKTYTFTYTDATGEWIDTFEESAKNIQFTMG